MSASPVPVAVRAPLSRPALPGRARPERGRAEGLRISAGPALGPRGGSPRISKAPLRTVQRRTRHEHRENGLLRCIRLWWKRGHEYLRISVGRNANGGEPFSSQGEWSAGKECGARADQDQDPVRGLLAEFYRAALPLSRRACPFADRGRGRGLRDRRFGALLRETPRSALVSPNEASSARNDAIHGRNVSSCTVFRRRDHPLRTLRSCSVRALRRRVPRLAKSWRIGTEVDPETTLTGFGKYAPRPSLTSCGISVLVSPSGPARNS